MARSAAVVHREFGTLLCELIVTKRCLHLRRPKRRVIGAEFADVVVAQGFGNWPHHLALAGAAPEEHELPLCEIVGLASERGGRCRLRNSRRAVTPGAALGQFFPRRS